MGKSLCVRASVYFWVTGSVSVTAVHGSVLESRLGQVEYEYVQKNEEFHYVEATLWFWSLIKDLITQFRL